MKCSDRITWHLRRKITKKYLVKQSWLQGKKLMPSNIEEKSRHWMSNYFERFVILLDDSKSRHCVALLAWISPLNSHAIRPYHSSLLAGLSVFIQSIVYKFLLIRQHWHVCDGIHRRMSLMSSSLLPQQCPTCLGHFICIVLEMGGRWPYSCCFIGCCF